MVILIDESPSYSRMYVGCVPCSISCEAKDAGDHGGRTGPKLNWVSSSIFTKKTASALDNNT